MLRSVILKSLVRRLVERVNADEYPELVKKTIAELRDEEKREVKGFCPKYLDSEAWDENNIDLSLRDVDVDVI